MLTLRQKTSIGIEMKRAFFWAVLLLWALAANAQYDFLRPVKGAFPGGYDFWVYTPTDYYYTLEQTPLIIFLHGASLCGRDLNKVRRYGPLDAIVMGRQIDALVVVPQNGGGQWDPGKIYEVLEWTKRNYEMDSTRVYVLGMSLGGYGTLDFAGSYPHKIAAAMAICGGSTLRDLSGLAELPLWIIHGTADKAVSIRHSKSVVEAIKAAGGGSRLRYDWLQGAGHGLPARIFYMRKTYEWLFSHSLLDEGRPVNRTIKIGMDDMPGAYKDKDYGEADPDIISGNSITIE